MRCLAWILLSFCAMVSSHLDDKSCKNGEDCSHNNIISMPLLDDMKATLRADLDVTEMNKFLKTYVQQVVKNGIETEMTETIQKLVNNYTIEMDSRISEKLKVLIDNITMEHTACCTKQESTSDRKQHQTSDLNVRDCSDLKTNHHGDGVYHIYPTGEPGFKVYCDMTTDGGGWTVFQRRLDGSISFPDKLWNDYKKGFGNISHEFWLGNDKLHNLTKHGKYELRINLKDWQNKMAYAVYTDFTVGDEESNYILSLGKYSGTAGDSMKTNNKQQFSTTDKNNSGRRQTSCSSKRVYGGVWWFPMYCGYSDLNGEYQRGGKGLSPGQGLIWKGWRGFGYSLKGTQMMIRRT